MPSVGLPWTSFLRLLMPIAKDARAVITLSDEATPIALRILNSVDKHLSPVGGFKGIDRKLQPTLDTIDRKKMFAQVEAANQALRMRMMLGWTMAN